MAARGFTEVNMDIETFLVLFLREAAFQAVMSGQKGRTGFGVRFLLASQRVS